jgi:hypothetical protein
VAKILVQVRDTIFTGPIHLRNKKTNKIEVLVGKKARACFTAVDPANLGIEVISTNKNAKFSFSFLQKDMENNGVFVVKLNSDASGLEAQIEGSFEINQLRPGVAPKLAKLGKALDLRIRGIVDDSYYGFKDGPYRGFIAYIKDSDYEQKTSKWRNTVPKVAAFRFEEYKQ